MTAPAYSPAARSGGNYLPPVPVQRRWRDGLRIWWREIDKVLLALILLLMAVGIVAVAAASPASAAIHFTGRVPHGEVERYYSLVDVQAYPRKASRLTELVTPLKPLEAMAQGCLVAASDVGGHRELMVDGETGVLFPPDDAEACADALAALLDARHAWPALRERARSHVRDRHDWARNIRRYQDVYQLLLTRRADGKLSAAA